MARSDLQFQGRNFAGTIQALLNKTVADNARVASLLRGSNVVMVGTNLDRRLTTRPVALRSTSSRYRCHLEVRMHLRLEDDTNFLTTAQSSFGAGTDVSGSEPFVHYDFERGKADYGEAHVQVHGRNEGLEAAMGELCVKRKSKRLNGLHLPVGGRRFRPSLEDLLEFLIDEGLAEPKAGWRDALNETRDEFRRIQLKAAVRSDPVAAAETLRENGWQVDEPPLIVRQRRARHQQVA